MKHLNKFNNFINEVIYPDKFKLATKLKDLVGQPFDYQELLDEINDRYKEDKIIFLDYNDFLKWFDETGLSKTYPPPPPPFAQVYPGVAFAAHFPEFEEILVITKNHVGRNFDNHRAFLKFDKEIAPLIKHEMLHTKQAAQKNLDNVPNADVSNPKDYLSHPDEIMAMANTAAHQIFNKNVTIPDDVALAANRTQAGDGYIRFFDENDPVRKKFLKYVYMYLVDLYKPKEDTINDSQKEEKVEKHD